MPKFPDMPGFKLIYYHNLYNNINIYTKANTHKLLVKYKYNLLFNSFTIAN